MTDYIPAADRMLAQAEAQAGIIRRAPTNGNGRHADDMPEPTGWERVDLGPWLDGTAPDDSPQLARRTDGQALLYRGKIHALNGEPESGKSWCAQHIAAQHIAAGDSVTYLDFEDSAGAITGRILALGATPNNIRDLFHYHHIDQPFSLEASMILDDALTEARPTLAILDGVTEAMTLCGLNPYDNSDVAKFWAIIPRRLARTGAAGLLLDHVTKDREERGRWAIGAQHKMAAIDGAAFMVEPVMPFGRNKTGLARISITKDRPGHLRQHATGNTIAEFRMASQDKAVNAVLEAPRGGDQPFQPTHIMQRISETLEHGPALTSRQIRGAVKGKNDHIDLALRLLVTGGYVDIAKVGAALYHSSAKPYRQTPDSPVEDNEKF